MSEQDQSKNPLYPPRLEISRPQPASPSTIEEIGNAFKIFLSPLFQRSAEYPIPVSMELFNAFKRYFTTDLKATVLLAESTAGCLIAHIRLRRFPHQETNLFLRTLKTDIDLLGKKIKEECAIVTIRIIRSILIFSNFMRTKVACACYRVILKTRAIHYKSLEKFLKAMVNSITGLLKYLELGENPYPKACLKGITQDLRKILFATLRVTNGLKRSRAENAKLGRIFENSILND